MAALTKIDSRHGIKLDGHKFTLKFNEMIPPVQKVVLRSYHFARATEEIVLIRIRGATPAESILVLNISQKSVTLVHGKIKVIITPGSTTELLSIDPNNTTDFYIESDGKKVPLNGPLQSVLPPLLASSIPKGEYKFQVMQTNTSNIFRAQFESGFPAVGKSWKAEFGLATVHPDVLVIRDPVVIRIKNLSKSNEIQLIGRSKDEDHKIKPGDMAALEPFRPDQTAGWYVKVADGAVIGLGSAVKSVYNQ